MWLSYGGEQREVKARNDLHGCEAASKTGRLSPVPGTVSRLTSQVAGVHQGAELFPDLLGPLSHGRRRLVATSFRLDLRQ
jgi:hypothetical protein